MAHTHSAAHRDPRCAWCATRCLQYAGRASVTTTLVCRAAKVTFLGPCGLQSRGHGQPTPLRAPQGGPPRRRFSRPPFCRQCVCVVTLLPARAPSRGQNLTPTIRHWRVCEEFHGNRAGENRSLVETDMVNIMFPLASDTQVSTGSSVNSPSFLPVYYYFAGRPNSIVHLIRMLRHEHSGQSRSDCLGTRTPGTSVLGHHFEPCSIVLLGMEHRCIYRRAYLPHPVALCKTDLRRQTGC